MSISAKLFNALCKKGDALKIKDLKTPEDIVRFDNISYGEEGEYNLLDCYRPKNATEPLPVIVSIHGGGYVYGTKEIYQYYCMSLAQRGFALINFNYRLAPMWKFPSPLEDSCAVLRWMLSNSKEYLFDTENVFILGDSAGAQLSSQLAVMLKREDYAALFDFETPKTNLKAIGLNCGMYDISTNAKTDVKGLMRDYFGKKPVPGDKRRDVLDYIDSDYPPCYLMSGNGDFLNKNVAPMKQLLDERGVDCAAKIYGDPDKKDLMHVFHVDIRLQPANECNDDECNFFKKYIVK